MNNFTNTLKLLRFPFSIFLLPVSLFSFYFINVIYSFNFILLLFIWHILIFPSSNGYNSYNDADEGSIGGLAKPPKPTKLLLQLSIIMDLCAIGLSFLINYYFAFFVIVYIIFSRLYSNKLIRLKKYPIISFLIVFIFQGLWIFIANIFALSNFNLFSNHSIIVAAITSSFFIATIYPLTQIYQHKADAKDGVLTLSMLLGIKGTFIFSALMFLLATIFMYLVFTTQISYFIMFILILLPATIYFIFGHTSVLKIVALPILKIL